VVKAEDLKKKPPRAAGAHISGADASRANSNGEAKETENQDSANGTTRPQAGISSDAEALPIQSVKPDPHQDNTLGAAQGQAQEDKQWEKIPKQDTHAASLLTESPLPADLDWIDPSLVTDYSGMGYGRTSNPETAQVHPYHFTKAMAELAAERGVEFKLGAKVMQINHSKTSVGSIEFEDRTTGGEKVMDGITDVVVTAGPWTGRILPKTKVEGLRAHSVVYKADISPYAVFTDIALPNDWAPEHRVAKGQRRKHRGNVDPEIYARPFGEVYACGMLSFPHFSPALQVQTTNNIPRRDRHHNTAPRNS
jgi:glycine/D-amino acid oxidase-like deaminating enzyme